MAYDEVLAARVRAALADEPDIEEKRGFGGLMFLAGGHMAFAVTSKGQGMVRCSPEQGVELVGRPGAAPMEMRGRTMKGWLELDPVAMADDADLAEWVGIGVAYVRSLPPK